MFENMSGDAASRPTLEDLEAEAAAAEQDYFEFVAEWLSARRRDA